ncbi:MAG: hypothetical protein KA419_17380 [Acidobacteria bacterium]|nr:hypothetical protein [Acidobacteriota bacterium]
MKVPFRPRGEAGAPDPRRALVGLLGPCPQCGCDAEGHAHWRLASAARNCRRGREAEIEGLIAAGAWGEAADVREWRAGAEVVEYYALRCPKSPLLSLKKVVFSAALDGDVRELADRVLSAADTAVLATLAAGQWRNL